MHKANQLSSPFKCAFGTQPTAKEDKDDLFDRNPAPAFGQPRDMGPDAIPTTFEEGVLGKRYYGSSLTSEAAVSSPMGKKR
jgi:hypothetical protein